MRTDGFYELSESELTQYLSHDHLKTETEEEIFDGVLEWCQRQNKLDRFPHLGPLIRFNLISIKHILKRMRDITANKDVVDFFVHELSSIAAGSAAGTVSRPRFCTQVLVAIIWAIFGAFLDIFSAFFGIVVVFGHFLLLKFWVF